MNNRIIGYEAGERCNREGCDGLIETREVEGCSCHISPPCSACTTPKEHCPVCGWDARFDEGKPEPPMAKWERRITELKERVLDPTKIDWHSRSHTHFSMIKEGIYPAGTTREDVLAQVEGTFGGRFEHFGGGKFKYIAYTD